MDVTERRRRPWTIDEARVLFASRGYTLLEQQYTSNRQPMRYRCPAGHEHTQRFSHFASGHGCPYCRSERRWSGRRINLDDILLVVEDEGFTDVEVRRNAGRIRIAYTCAAGHRASTQYSHFVKGKRCRGCFFLRRRGPGNHRYNSDLTDEERATRRHYEEYFAWRRAVFERDGYACRRCAGRGRLNAHHVVNYSAARDLRTAIANGITLCTDCHRGFHAIYGYRNNDADQLRFFMEVK